MRQLTSVEHKELTSRKHGATSVFDAEEQKHPSRRGRLREIGRFPPGRGEEAELPEVVCEACGEAMDLEGAERVYCQRCFEESAMEAEAIARQQTNRAEALASERDEQAARVEELTRLLQSRECQIKKLSSRVESLERDWRNLTEENQQLRQTVQNTELRLTNAELERRLVIAQYQDASLQEVQAAIDALRREMRCKEQKLAERLSVVERSLEERGKRDWRSFFLAFLRPEGQTSDSS